MAGWNIWTFSHADGRQMLMGGVARVKLEDGLTLRLELNRPSMLSTRAILWHQMGMLEGSWYNLTKHIYRILSRLCMWSFCIKTQMSWLLVIYREISQCFLLNTAFVFLIDCQKYQLWVQHHSDEGDFIFLILLISTNKQSLLLKQWLTHVSKQKEQQRLSQYKQI